jgi:hypothetical protein
MLIKFDKIKFLEDFYNMHRFRYKNNEDQTRAKYDADIYN